MEEQFQFTNKLKTIFAGISVVGLLIALIGIFAFDVSAYRVWGTFLTVNVYFILAGLSGVVLLAIQYATNAGWSAGLKRIFEAMGNYSFIGFLTMLIIILFGVESIYHHWADPALLDPDSEKYDPIVEGKAPYLNKPFFTFRYFLIFAIFLLFTYFFRKWSKQEDQKGEWKMYKKMQKFSYLFLIVFAFTFTLATYDWLMSIDSHWYSTIYSIYVFAGMLVTGFVITTLTAIYLQNNGYLSILNSHHFHDLGKFTFGMSIFWMYIWFAQFMLIWYANLPETNIYFIVRMENNWQYFFYANIIINFALPFLVLMTREAKRNFNVLIFVGIALLIGRFIDIYLLVQPGVTEAPFAFGLTEIGFFALFAGLFLFALFYSLSKVSLVPVNHPYLEESRHHEVFP